MNELTQELTQVKEIYLSVKVTLLLKRTLRITAAEQGIGMSELARRYITEGLERDALQQSNPH